MHKYKYNSSTSPSGSVSLLYAGVRVLFSIQFQAGIALVTDSKICLIYNDELEEPKKLRTPSRGTRQPHAQDVSSAS